jgi:hypothetical protein
MRLRQASFASSTLPPVGTRPVWRGSHHARRAGVVEQIRAAADPT